MDVKKEQIEFLQSDHIIESKLIYDGSILQLYRQKIKLEDGSEAFRELIHHQSAVAILAELDDNNILLVKQYRSGINNYLIEIPAGLLDYVQGCEEDALMGAKRELEEETGYQGKTWDCLGSFYLSPGYLNEKIIIFHAKDLIKVEAPRPMDSDEFIELIAMDSEQVKDLLTSGETLDIKTVYALQYWLNQLGE